VNFLADPCSGTPFAVIGTSAAMWTAGNGERRDQWAQDRKRLWGARCTADRCPLGYRHFRAAAAQRRLASLTDNVAKNGG